MIPNTIPLSDAATHDAVIDVAIAYAEIHGSNRSYDEVQDARRKLFGAIAEMQRQPRLRFMDFYTNPMQRADLSDAIKRQVNALAAYRYYAFGRIPTLRGANALTHDVRRLVGLTASDEAAINRAYDEIVCTQGPPTLYTKPTPPESATEPAGYGRDEPVTTEATPEEDTASASAPLTRQDLAEIVEVICKTTLAYVRR